MKNALNYYYNLIPTSIHQINNYYKCYVNNQEYVLIPYDNHLNNIEQIYELSILLFRQNIPCHQFLTNINKQLITIINEIPYVLLKIYIKNREILIDDLNYFSNLVVDSNYFSSLAIDNWYSLWSEKVDYLEYQISQFGLKYPIIRESFNYYVGIVENCISIIQTTNNKKQQKIISHRRIKNNDSTLEFYNPLNFILDNGVRDLGEYIKGRFFYGNYSINQALADISRFNLNSELYQLLYIRLLFPSYYFDLYEEIIFDNKDEKEILKIINRNSEYLFFIKELFSIIRKNHSIVEIEWIN